jgi:N-acetylneuraminic acid mutarotase
MTRRHLSFTAVGVLGLAVASCREAPTELEPTSAASAAAVAPNTWVTLKNMPTARFDLATAAVTNAAGRTILYAIGGSTATTGASLGKVEAYNVATNTWTTRAQLPRPLYWTNGVGVINGKLYISGGVSSFKNYRSELFVYDPATNTWTQKRDMPTQGFRGVTGVINNKLYVWTICDQEDCFDFIPHGAFYRYDPATDQWAVLPSSPHYHGWGIGGVIGGKFYVAGGSNQLDVYDPATNQWTTKAPMTSTRWLGAGAAAGGKLYFIGGLRRNADGSLTPGVPTTSVYDPATNKWTNKTPLPAAKSGISASRVVLNGQVRVQVVGGNKPGNNLAYIP